MCSSTQSANTILAPGISLASCLCCTSQELSSCSGGPPHLAIPFQLSLPTQSLSPHFRLFIKFTPKEPQTPENINMTGGGAGLPQSREKVTFLCLPFFFFKEQKGTWLRKHKQYLTACDRLPCQYKLMCFTGCLFPDIDSVRQLLYCQPKKISKKCQCPAVGKANAQPWGILNSTRKVCIKTLAGYHKSL